MVELISTEILDFLFQSMLDQVDNFPQYLKPLIGFLYHELISFLKFDHTKYVEFESSSEISSSEISSIPHFFFSPLDQNN